MKNNNDPFQLTMPPDGWPRIMFGESNGFEARHYDGWLTIICGGGTGFAIKANDAEEVKKLLEPITYASEYNVIRHCNKTKDWWIFDYYGWKLVPGIQRIHCFDSDSKFIETVQ